MKTSPDFLFAIAERLGWALLHSLWEGALIAAALAVALHCLRGHRATIRHAVCMIAMLLLAISVVGTAWGIHPASASLRGTRARAERAARNETAAELAPTSKLRKSSVFVSSKRALEKTSVLAAPVASARVWRKGCEPLLPWISALWAGGVALLTMRHFVGWRRMGLMRRNGTNARPELQRTFTRLLEKIGRTAGVRFLESADAAVPMLAGLLKPVVLLPLRVISGLGEQEIEAILAHELAHLVRRDAWSNLAQVAMETLFFYHPAMWWMGRCARQEREHAADDLALDICEDRRVYAGALARLAELRFSSPAALAATGGSLLARIRRIVRPAAVEAPAGGWSVGVPALLAVLALATIIRTQAEQVKTLEDAPNSAGKNGAHATTRNVEAEIETAFRSALSRAENWADWAKSADAILPRLTFETLNSGFGSHSQSIDLSLVPQVVEFEGFISYGSPITKVSPTLNPAGILIGSTQTVITPNVISHPISNTSSVTTSINIFDGQPVLIGGLLREGDGKTISVAAENQPDAKTAEEPLHKADDAKAWMSDAFQLEDTAKREAAIERIRTAMMSGNADEARAGVTAFVKLDPIEFDKASFRPAVRALLRSVDVTTRAAATRAFAMTGAEPDDLSQLYALANDPASEVRDRLTGVIVYLKNKDLRDQAASQAILTLMAKLPPDPRGVASSLQGAKFSPEIEARVLEFCGDLQEPLGVNYAFLEGALTMQANKSEASCKRLIELLAHHDTALIAEKAARGLQMGVDRAQYPLVAVAMVKVIEGRSDGILRDIALLCVRAYGDSAQVPSLKAMLAQTGLSDKFRNQLEDTLSALEAREGAGTKAPGVVASTIFLNAYLACGEGEKRRAAGDKAGALESWKRAISMLTQIARDDPSWKPEIVKRRRELAEQEVARLEPTLGETVALSPTPPAALLAQKPEIDVEWKGQWWPATILKKNGEKTMIHYIGYGGEWDEWVTPERVRPIAATAVSTEAQPSKTEEEKKKEEAGRRVEKNRQAARLRAADDRQTYQTAELAEIESLYQVANKNWRSEEARTSLKKLLEKFDHANRTGCATLYMGQMSEGQERLDYLTRAVEKFSDCYYFNGCQVGGYGRYVLALTLWDKGEKDKARALLAELKTTYKDATDHKGRPMGEVAEAVEKELAAKE